MPTLPVHVLVRDTAGRYLQTPTAGLPALEVTLPEDTPLVQGLLAELGRTWALEATVLETHIRADGDGHAALGVLEPPPAGWAAPDGLQWDGRVATLPDPLARRAERWIAEWDGTVPMPPQRAAWSRPGWKGRAAAWIAAALEAAGRAPAGPPQVQRIWALSALIRVPTAEGPSAWFKAVFPQFRHEPAVTRYLHRLRPDRLPAPIAVDEDEGWLLLDDVGGEPLGPYPDEAALLRSFEGLADVIRAAAGHERRLLSLGCPHRPLAALPDALRAAVARAPELEGPSIPAKRLDAVAAWVSETVAWLAPLGFGETLVHGDFNVSNVVDADGGPVIIDWSDAAISHPLVDVAPWLGHPRAPGDLEGQWQAWLDALAFLGEVGPLRTEQSRVLALSAAYHVVAYAAILEGIEPDSRYQISDGLRWWWSTLDERVPA